MLAGGPTAWGDPARGGGDGGGGVSGPAATGGPTARGGPARSGGDGDGGTRGPAATSRPAGCTAGLAAQHGWLGAGAWGTGWASDGGADGTARLPARRQVAWAPLPPKHESSSPGMRELTAARAGVGRGSGHAYGGGGRGTGGERGAWRAPPALRGAAAAADAARLDAVQRHEETRRSVAACGLDTPLGSRRGDEWLGRRPRGDAEAVVQRLRAGINGRVADVTETDRQRTALAWFGDFLADSDRVPFQAPDAEGGLKYNQETLDLFAVYMRDRGSRKRGSEGQPIKAAHIAATVAAIRLLREREQRGLVTSKADNLIAPLLYKQFRKEDGPAGQRRLSRGLRARHLRAAAEAGFDRSSERGRMRWAVATTALNLLLRGGEPGVTKRGKAVDPRRTITVSSFDWREPCEESRWRPWLVGDVVGIKDSEYTHRVTPMPICRRYTWREMPLGGDPTCAYDALYLLWRDRARGVPEAERRYRGGCTTPFFVGDDGAPWCTRDTQRLAKEIAAVLGIAPDEVGGKAFRIGGATDLREVHGDGAQRLIKERGRWASDVAQLYQRALLRTQLDSSAGAGAAVGRDLEEALQGWVQPAVYYCIPAAA